MKDYKTLLIQRNSNGIAALTINRPKKLNALNDLVLNELSNVFEAIKTDSDIRGIIVEGAGDKAFVAGADISELQEFGEQSGRESSLKGQQVFQQIEDLPKPVIAAVDGYALGGGCELAMACHMRFASPAAKFGLPEAGLGLIPGYGGTQRLPALVGRAQALQMILTGTPIDADEACRTGLVNEIADEPAEKAIHIMEKILKNAPLSIKQALKAVYRSGNDDGFETEAELFGRLCASSDSTEGLSAFLEKRKPEFEGV